MLNLNSIMIGTSDSKKLGDFYSKVLNVQPQTEEGGWYSFKMGSCSLSIGMHDKVTGMSQNPERLILNLETNDVKSEFERIKNLGTTVIKEPYEIPGWEGNWIATFADPDGNYFQLMPQWE